MPNKYSKLGYLWLVFAVIFFGLPLAATFEFSLHDADGYGFGAYSNLLDNPRFGETLWLSLRLAAETIVLTLALVIPAAYWAHTKFPRILPVMEALSILPFVVPPVVLAGALLDLFQGLPAMLSTVHFLVLAYVVVAFPFTFRMLDAGLRAVDLKTLTEAAESLGAPRRITMFRVILPNIRIAAVSAALLTLAVVLGEFAIANQALFTTFPVFINEVGHSQASVGAALTVVSFGTTWLAMAGLLVLGRGGRGFMRRRRAPGAL